VVTQTVTHELADVAARRGLSGALPAGVGTITEDTSIGLRATMMQQLQMFGAASACSSRAWYAWTRRETCDGKQRMTT